MGGADLLAERARTLRDADAPMLSPCISVCRMDATRTMCEGCFRTIDEIRAWSRSDDAGRRAIWGRVLDRAGIESL